MSRSMAGSRGNPSSFSLTVLRCISLLPPATDITMALSHDEPIGPLSEPSSPGDRGGTAQLDGDLGASMLLEA